MINLSVSGLKSSNYFVKNTAKNVVFKGNSADTFIKSSDNTDKSQGQDTSENSFKAIQDCEAALEKNKAEIKAQEKVLKELSKSGSFDDYMISRKKIEQLYTESQELKEKIRSARTAYFNTLSSDNNTAFFYDDRLSVAEKRKIIAQHDEIIPLEDYYDQIRSFCKSKIRTEIFSKWQDKGLFKAETLKKGEQYVDTSHPQNIEFTEKLAKTLPTCVNSADFRFLYNFRDSSFYSEVKDGLLVPLYADSIYQSENFMIDCENPVNKQRIADNSKLNPQPDLRYYKSELNDKDIFVPFAYLSKLGFGNVDDILDIARAGKIKSKYILHKAKDGIERKILCANIADTLTEHELRRLRKKSDFIISTLDYEKKYDITPEKMKAILLSGELEIIPKYIFSNDFKQSYIDLRKEKNSEFTEKIKPSPAL